MTKTKTRPVNRDPVDSQMARQGCLTLGPVTTVMNELRQRTEISHR